MWDEDELGPDDDEMEDFILFAAIAEDPANHIPSPGDVECEQRMYLGDERFEMVRQYNDDVAIASLRVQQATVNCIYAQGQVRSAVAGAIRGATVAVLAATPFLVLRLFRR